jgi:cytochrome c biogenesis protein CcmG/thiol:disulfide interchange protein DsbE
MIMKHAVIRSILFTPVFFTLLTLVSCSGEKQPDADASSSAELTAAGSQQPANLPDAPDFTLETSDGSDFTLLEHEGSVILLNIWATWCPPCKEEIPYFIEIQEEMREEGVLFVGVATDAEGWDVVRPFAEEFGINYPIVVDDGSVVQKYGPIQGIPMSFIINRQGKVEYAVPGMVTKEMLQPVLAEIAER